MKRLLMRRLLRVVYFVCSCVVLASCSSDDDDSTGTQAHKGYMGLPLVVLDTDIGSSTDDLFAMQMLYHFEDMGLCKLLGVVVDREGEDYAACADVMNTFYGHGNVPIGLERNGIKNPGVFTDYRKIHSLTDGAGESLYKRTLTDYATLPDGWQLYRRLLAAQPDHSVTICSTGFVTSLAHLLESQPDDLSPLTGVELVRQKVKCLYIMAGIFTESAEPDYNFMQGIGFAQTFFELWPKDVNVEFSSMEVGNGITYLREQVLADLSDVDRHPIKYIYEKMYSDEGGQKMWDPLTVIQAIRGDGLFTLSERGFVSITPQGATLFTPSATGNCRYQKAGSAEWNASMLETIRKFNRMR